VKNNKFSWTKIETAGSRSIRENLPFYDHFDFGSGLTNIGFNLRFALSNCSGWLDFKSEILVLHGSEVEFDHRVSGTFLCGRIEYAKDDGGG
jgi:hypothetical protein